MKIARKKKYYIFNSEPGVNILGLDPIIRAFWGEEMKKFSGTNLSAGIFYEFEKGKFRAGAHIKEWNGVSKHFLKKIREENFEREMISSIKDRAKKIEKVCKESLQKIKKGNISKSDRKKYVQELFVLFQSICEYGLIVPIIEIASSDLGKEIEDIIKNKLDDPSKFSDAALLLTYPYTENLDNKEQKSLAQLVFFVYDDSGMKNNFLSDSDISFGELPADLRKKITGHVEQWGWAHYGYCGPEYSNKDVIREIKGMLALGKSPKIFMNHLEDEISKNNRKQQKLLKKLKFSTEELHLLKIARNVAETKNLRTKMMFYANYTINKLMKPFIVEEGLSLQQYGMCTVQEILNYFTSGKLPSTNELNQRYSYCILFSSIVGEKFLLSDKARNWFENNVYVEEVDENIHEISGQVSYASKDIITGTAKIIDVAEDMEKFNDGDILVSIATTPEIVPVMKRAAAILTDIGGMTCHAAIVSRELKVPCIVGLKVVTKFIKNGDKVEVDTTKGTVKKL